MADVPLTLILILLGSTVAAVVAAQRLHIPTSLAYLLVGVLLGPHTGGPVIQPRQIEGLAEFGIVFLLFTIGLNFSLPQIYALRHHVLGLGTAQVLLTTAVVGSGAWALGLPAPAAFVTGAVFAQSSTTIISKLLADHGEERTSHGRLAIAMSVFQDITAVPFVVIIPVLGGAASAVAGPILWTLANAALAFAAVYVAGRWWLPPLFQLVAARRSAEVFTLTVLFVALVAAWASHSLGLSMAFGAFLLGMMLGETEFRHQVEATIRPFRDVLLGLFFVAIGMLFDPQLFPRVGPVAVAVAAAVVAIKAALVAQIARLAGIDAFTAWRTGLTLAVGGEFGFALLAIGLTSGVLTGETGQILITATLASMVSAPWLTGGGRTLARLLSRRDEAEEAATPSLADLARPLQEHVVICGYGRIGQGLGRVLDEEGIPYVALDLNASRVREAHRSGAPVYYGDATDRTVLEMVGLARARLLVIGHNDMQAALQTLSHARGLRPDLPVMVRTRDERHVEALRAAGATEVVPETLEASLMIASHALLLLDVPGEHVLGRMRADRTERYRLLSEWIEGDAADEATRAAEGAAASERATRDREPSHRDASR